MIELRQARGGELAQAEKLWTDTFGDDREFQQAFYRLTGLEGPLVLLENGRVVSMLTLPEVALAFPDRWQVRAGYVYALATCPEARGRGHASRLMDYAAEVLKNHGADCLLTVPANPALFDFFGRNGFQAAFYHRRLRAEPKAASNIPVPPMDYAALREALLAGRTHITYTSGQLELQRTLCSQQGSGLYRLELDHGPACAAVENWRPSPVVKELLCAHGDEAQGIAAAAALCGGPAEIRLPAGPGEGIPFGGIRWLFSTPPSRWKTSPNGYLGLAFD